MHKRRCLDGFFRLMYCKTELVNRELGRLSLIWVDGFSIQSVDNKEIALEKGIKNAPELSREAKIGQATAYGGITSTAMQTIRPCGSLSRFWA